MSSPRTTIEPPAMDQSNAMILGEMRGQLREVVHSVNGLSARFDGLTREVIGLGPLATDINDLKTRIAALEATKNRDEGARGLGTLLLKSPVIGWLVGFGATVWAVVSGKAHL